MKVRRLSRAVQAFALTVAVILLVRLGVWFLPRGGPSPYDWLLHAVYSGDIRAVDAELEEGTDPNKLPSDEDKPIAPICAAAQIGRLDILKLLMDHGASIYGGDSWDHTPLEAAARYDQTRVMEYLIARGAPVNDGGPTYSYALWQTAIAGRLEPVRVLLAHGANANSEINGERLLHAVEGVHQDEVADELRRAGAKE